MGFSPDVKQRVLVACGRCCALCHKFCGIKIEIHHIVEQGADGDDSYDNAIPLCLDCHADMRSYDHKHPKGSKYTREELKQHRDGWYARVSGGLTTATRSEIASTDREVFRRLVALLPMSGTIGFLKTVDLASGPFPISRLYDLETFQKECDDPSFEFIDPDLESLRVALATRIHSLQYAVFQETFDTDTPGYQSIPKEWLNEESNRYQDAELRLDRETRALLESYDSMIRTAVRRLGELPK